MACVYMVLKTVLGFNLLLKTVAEGEFNLPRAKLNSMYESFLVCKYNTMCARASCVTSFLSHIAPSGPPQDVTAVVISPRTVQVTWNDVLVAERNGVLTEYEVIIFSCQTIYTNDRVIVTIGGYFSNL